MAVTGGVRYSSLRQGSDSDDESSLLPLPDDSSFQFGSSPGTFESAFTYAPYGDLDRMGYQVPKRFRSDTFKTYTPYTYTPSFEVSSTFPIFLKRRSNEYAGERPLHHVSQGDADDRRPVNVWTPVEQVIVVLSFLIILVTLPLSLLFTIKFVSTNERLVVLRLGRAQKTRGPGTAVVLPCIDTTHRVDTRVTAFNVPPMHIITVDRGLVELAATVYLRVRDAVAAVCQVQDRNSSMRTLASSMLYRYVSKKRICELTGGHDRREIASLFKDELGHFTASFGVEITQVELSEMKIIKEAENMGLASLSAVAKSEVGQQLWSVIGPTIEEISKEAAMTTGPSSSRDAPPSTVGDLVDLHSHEDDVDIDRIITIVNMGIDQALALAIGKVYQFECDGIDNIVIDLRKGNCYKGNAHLADVVLRIDRKALMPILKQELSPMTAYMNGSLKLSGSIQDALSLRLLTDRIVHLL